MKPINALLGMATTIFLGMCGVGAYAIHQGRKRQTIKKKNTSISEQNGIVTVTQLKFNDGKGPDAETRASFEEALGPINWRVCPECGEEKFSYDPEELCGNCK
jgi:hypothetical protein